MKNYYGEDEIVLFHGTICGDNILEEGFDNLPGCWDCSEFNLAYFYEYTRYCECEGWDKEDESAYFDILSSANSQGQIQNAFLVNPAPHTDVLEFHFPKEFKEYITEDCSCENMVHYGAVEVNISILNKWMKEGKCKIIFHRYPFLTKCSLMYLTGIYNNPMASSAISSLPEYEQKGLEALVKGGFNEDFYDCCITCVEEIEEPREINYPLCTKLEYDFN